MKTQTAVKTQEQHDNGTVCKHPYDCYRWHRIVKLYWSETLNQYVTIPE